ncbi:MAG: aminotransferase class I/II-fold pyridoxal phosphate-dependent enzyme, partial [bacterium]|nr:aminotransferase class I/II-fold pyridoxal phosphate-dependent enzyme [bacterium]
MSSSKAAKAFHVFWEIINRERVVWPQKKELLSRARRVAALKRAGYNLFRLPSRAVFIDLLTDSGTARMSEAQWLSMFRGDESYAGSESWFRLRKKIQEVFTFSYVLPVHQGRAAERVFFEATLKPQKNIIVGNTPFDTTRYWIETCGGKVVDCLCAANYDDPEQAPFFGNVDLQKLESALKAHRGAVACMLITITCNSAGGQPVSFENIRAARKLAKRYGIPLFLDAA